MASNSERPASDAVEQKVVALAEQMGRMIGVVHAKAEGWLDRTSLTEQLTRIRENAAEVLAHLNPAVASARPVARRTSRKGGSGRAGGSGKKTSGPGRSGGKVDAPGKKHRAPMPPVHGLKHSDERIAKLRLANEVRRRRKG
jgi:hypothetical protein